MKKNILICPLEWGLGHAGRMVPVARKLISMGHAVFIGSGDSHKDFFRTEVPDATYIRFPGFRIRYSGILPQYIVVFLRSPAFIYHSVKEHLILRRIIRENEIDIVISDSRIGLWNRNISTVLVTHMLRIPHPRWLVFFENAGLSLTRRVLNKFTFCFVPDLPGDINISGKLAHDLVLTDNTRYIGILSRFASAGSLKEIQNKKYFCTVILSGPEPQRTILCNKITSILDRYAGSSVILEAKPGEGTRSITKGKITYISHPPDNMMVSLISESENIITRSGYSTLMELVSLCRSAIIIPTPGQPEQEYLGQYMSRNGWFYCINQDDLNNDSRLETSGLNIPAGINADSKILLDKALGELLEKK